MTLPSVEAVVKVCGPQLTQDWAVPDMTTPWQRYQADLQQEGFSHDPAQEQAVLLLQDLYERLVASSVAHDGAIKVWINKLRGVQIEPQVGLYFWGGVGRGKTYLVDTFFECLPFPRKLRVHFHRFMQRVHADLTSVEGEKNPLESVADRISQEARVLCFDEFFVTDIADAMILGDLMKELFARGVTLVATSNIEPVHLYKNGLQRQRFLPAIELLEKYTQVVNVDAGIDYRLRTLEQAALYHSPLNEAASKSIESSFKSLASGPGKHWERIEINHRYLTCRRVAKGVAWFEFAELCAGPRSQNDYIELSRIFHSVLISGIPCFLPDMDDQARRFVNLVDEFYDRSVKLVLTAAVPLLELYGGGQLGFEFQRTISRLQEMQSYEYLAREHLP
jgi:cell division protein ZapE